MNRILEKGKRAIGKLSDKGNRAIIMGMTAAVLAGGLSACGSKKTIEFDKDPVAKEIKAKFSEEYARFHKKEQLTINTSPILLYDDSTKTVMLSSKRGLQCSFVYKGKNRRDVYSWVNTPEGMTVSTIENGKLIRNDEVVPLEEAENVLKEITGYIK